MLTRRIASRAPAGALALAIVVAGSLLQQAGAQPDGPKPASTDSDKERSLQAKEYFQDATRYMEQGKYAEALERYRWAYELVPRAKILLNIATLLLELGREVEAANAFAEYTELKDADPQRVVKVRQILSGLDAKLGRLQITATGPGGRVLLDGEAIGAIAGAGRFRAEIRVAPGRHSVQVERAQGPPARRDVTVAAGAASAVAVSVEAVSVEAVSVEAVEDAAIGDTPGPLTIAKPHRLPRFIAFLRLDFDPVHVGGVAAPGLAVHIASSIYGYGNALIGSRAGGELGVRWEPDWPRVKLRASLSLPLFFSDGARAGGRAALGLVWGIRFRGVAELGLAHHPSTPERFAETVFLTAIGMEMGF